jgi:hypothetical protein
MPKLLNMWLTEKSFIFSHNVSNNQIINVLSRVPSYKINLTSPVSADRFRGNIFHRLSIINFDRALNQTTPSFLTKLNAFSFIEFFKKNTRLVNYTFLKKKAITQPSIKLNPQLTYMVHKSLRLFLNSALKRKFYKKFPAINIKKIIKNKRKRKEYAIKRTAKLDTVDPVKKFQRLFLKKLLFGKRLNPIRTSLKQRKSQRYKYILRLRFFRKDFLKRKQKNRIKTRFIKNMLYFSHTKLHNECKILNEFRNVKFKRKRVLFKTASTTNNTMITTQPHTFFTQKSKT